MRQHITDWRIAGVAHWVIRLDDVFKPLKNCKASLVGGLFCLFFVSLGEYTCLGFVKGKTGTGLFLNTISVTTKAQITSMNLTRLPVSTLLFPGILNALLAEVA